MYALVVSVAPTSCKWALRKHYACAVSLEAVLVADGSGELVGIR